MPAWPRRRGDGPAVAFALLDLQCTRGVEVLVLRVAMVRTNLWFTPTISQALLLYLPLARWGMCRTCGSVHENITDLSTRRVDISSQQINRI